MDLRQNDWDIHSTTYEIDGFLMMYTCHHINISNPHAHAHTHEHSHANVQVNTYTYVCVSVCWKVITFYQGWYKNKSKLNFFKCHHQNLFINIYIRGAFNKFPDFFVQEFKIAVDSWKFITLLLYIVWDDWTIFMISGSNEQLQQQLKYTLLKPDCRSWWISTMQSGVEGT